MKSYNVLVKNKRTGNYDRKMKVINECSGMLTCVDENKKVHWVYVDMVKEVKK